MALSAALAVGLLSARSAAADPAVPSIPTIPTIPGGATARFKVVFEGTATAAKDADWSEVTPCTILVNASIRETTTFQRGKGLVLEFVRFGKGPRAPIIVQRAGRRFDSSLVLTTTTTRTASGSASRANLPLPNPPVCAPLNEDLSKGPDCGKPQVDKVTASFLYTRSLLSLKMSRLQPLEVIDCPASQIAADLDVLKFSWPTPPKLPQFAIPAGVIFGKRKVIVRSAESGIVKEGPVTTTAGTLSMTRSDFGTNRATIRLVRVP